MRNIAAGAVAGQARVCVYKVKLRDFFAAIISGGWSEMATIKFLDPRAAVNPKERPLVPGLDSLEGKVIGIIDNGQSNSTDMFKELGKLLQERLHVKEVLFRTKPSHMQGAPRPIMEEMLNRCDAVITGLGA
jgi:hypothetical protein